MYNEQTEEWQKQEHLKAQGDKQSEQAADTGNTNEQTGEGNPDLDLL